MSAKPTFIKPKLVTGNNLVFRDATRDDAAFIIALRTDADKARFISATSPDVQKQVVWLENYAKDPSQIYFVIQDKAGAPVGTVRLYDQRDDSFCWGSWILKAGTPSGYSVESALIIYHYARALGFTKSHFDVRKENASVWKFHERFGATRTEETDIDYLYTIDADAIAASLDRYAKFLPHGISITP